MKKLLIILLFVAGTAQAQDNYNHYALGNQAMQEGDYRQAEEYYRLAAAKEPTNWVIMSQLGYCLMKQNRYREADSTFNIILDNDKTVEKAWWFKGLCAMRSGRDSVAVVAFKAFIPLAKKSGGNLIGAYSYVGKSYEKMLYKTGLTFDEIEDMIYHYEQIERLDPSNPELPVYLSFIDKIKKLRPGKEAGRWIPAE